MQLIIEGRQVISQTLQAAVVSVYGGGTVEAYSYEQLGVCVCVCV